MIADEEAKTKLTRARATLILDQPFFGALALRLSLVEDYTVKTLATNGKVIKYNPDYINDKSACFLKAVMAHEVMHNVLDHLSRLGERDNRKWNQATDYAINQILTDVGFDFEGKGLLNAAYIGMGADHIYTLLPDEPEGGEGDGPGNDPLDDLEPGDPDPATKSEMARDWKIATIQAAEAAKIMGKMPGELERFIDGLLKPQIDWKATLRRFITERAKDNYSWQRPNRAMLVHGVYMPSLYSESMGDIVIGVDTSGSVDDATLMAFSAECEAIIAETQPANVHVVYCDYQVAGATTFARHEQFELKALGGGGTRFEPVFDWVEKHGIKPVCLVYLTDLYGPVNFDPPPYPTLWCCTNEAQGPFGETVQIEVNP